MLVFITRSDGGVEIMRLIDPKATVNGELSKWKAIHPGEYVSHREGDESEVPADRTFRNAWKDGGRGIEHDMGKAREIHKERLRLLAPKLNPVIEAAINAAKTPEELKTVR